MEARRNPAPATLGWADTQADQQEGDKAGSGAAEVAGARPDKVSGNGDGQEQSEGGTGAEDLESPGGRRRRE